METTSRLVATALINSLWQVSLVWAIAACGARFLASAPARFRHALWVIALALSLALPIASLHGGIGLRRAGAAADAASVAPTQASRVERFAPLVDLRAAEKPLRDTAWTLASAATAVRRFRNLLAGRARPVPWSPLVGYGALAIYLLSLLFHAIRLVRAWMKTQEIRTTAHAREIPEWMAAVASRCAREFGAESRRSAVALLFSSRIAGPLTLGARRPAIILPEGLLKLESNASREELASALCHEMAHVRRRDFLMNLVYELLLLPLAFHPAARIIKRRIDETRELACDELAAGHGVSPSTYARSLVSLATRVSRLASRPPLAGPGYTLGVFDANILEERIMRLLDQRPRLSARRAMLLLAAASFALTASALAANTFSLSVEENAPQTASIGGSAGLRAGYSGRWELDKAKSELPEPAPDNLVEVIELRDSTLKINTTSKDWSTQKPIAVTLFALTIPEFVATTNNAETTQPYGPGALKSKTRWEGARLVTDWQLERDGKVAVAGTWTRSLAADGKTQIVEVKAEDPQQGRHGSARLVFVKNATAVSDLERFVGTWRHRIQGQPIIVLTLTMDRGKPAGTVTAYPINGDEGGDPAKPTRQWRITDGAVEGETLTLTGTDDEGGVMQFVLRLTSDREARFKPLGVPPPPGQPEGDGPTMIRDSGAASLPDTVKPYLGTWIAKFQGKPFTTLILKSEGTGLSGTLSPFRMELDVNGNLTEATPLDHVGGWHVIQAKLDGTGEPRLALTCKEDDDGSIDNFEMKVTGSGEAEFRPVGQPLEVKPWKMTKDPEQACGANVARPCETQGYWKTQAAVDRPRSGN